MCTAFLLRRLRRLFFVINTIAAEYLCKNGGFHMSGKRSYDVVCDYLSSRIRNILQIVPEQHKRAVNEIRLRCERPVCLYFSDRTGFLCSGGVLSDRYDEASVVRVSKSEVDEIFKALCRYSVHCCSRELSQGYFTVENGIRVGISGSISKSADKSFKYISGLNFRISREIPGVADSIFSSVFSSGLKSVLICGGVNSGKTTILRDLCRSCGNRYKTSLIDERNEISASVGGIPTNEVGIQTDIIEGCTREDGIISAIRSLSPQLIFCDELCSDADSDAVMSGFGCGIKFAATVHAESLEDLSKRRFLHPLLENGVFDYAIFLEGNSFPGKIREIRRLN